MSRAAVAFFIFNRPSLTEQVFGSIAAARPPRLLVVGDGPRPDHSDDEYLVAQARAVIGRVDWPCEVLTCYSDHNLGCRQRVATGLDWVFSQVEEAIVLEDDTLPDASFFPYCEELLARYRGDSRVHMVSGFTIFEPGRVTSRSYYFSRCYHIWGWAGWARAWASYDIEMRRWPEVRDTQWLEQLLGDPIEARIARDIFDQTHSGRITTWDFQWVFASWLDGGVSVTPAATLVTNIGYGQLASHERSEDHPLAKLPRYAIDLPLRHPDEVTVLEKADHAEWRRMYPSYFDPGRADRAWRERLLGRRRAPAAKR